MSCEFSIGHQKPSSRVLKPPGGGHTDFFSAAEGNAPKPRPKYDQQNSSNLNFVMNTTDPNELVKHGEASFSESPVTSPTKPEQHEHDHDDAPPTPPKSNGAEFRGAPPTNGSSPAADNLPKYHHHRSTNLW